MQAGQNTHVPRAFCVRAEERAQCVLEDQRKPCPSCLLRTQKWPGLETLKQLLSLCLGLFTASAPFHKQPSLAAICHSYRWLDKDKERESAAHCVFLGRLMSALDQKSWEAALALEWGEGPLDKPLRTGCPLMNPIPLTTRQRRVRREVPLFCSPFHFLFGFYLFLYSTSIYWILAMCQVLGKQREQISLVFVHMELAVWRVSQPAMS